MLDRRSDLIVSGGENIYPAEVEAALLEHPEVLEAGVAGVSDREFGHRPQAWVVMRAGSVAAEETLRGFCRERLAAFKVPERVHCVGSLPRNAAGKLQRHLLAKAGR